MRKLHHPNKPHFFQPLLPGFLHNFSIPISFFLNYLNGSTNEQKPKKEEKMVELRDKTGKKWYVKLVKSTDDHSKPRFKDGWEKFCKDHDLQIGDFLVFRHQGNLAFDVFIFAPTACERRFPGFEPIPKIIGSNDKIDNPSTNNQSVGMKLKGKIKEDAINNQNGRRRNKRRCSSLKSPNYPWCRLILMPSSVRNKGRRGTIHLPRDFTEANGLSKRWCDMELIDEKGQTWNTILRYSKRKNGGSYIGGWGKIHRANPFKVGDALIFQLINSGSKPVMKFYCEQTI